MRSRMSQVHQLRFRELPSEIVEIETSMLTLFIKRDHQISNGLSFRSASRGVAKLFPLCFTLRLLSPLFLPCPLFLSLREVCTRGPCHMDGRLSTGIDSVYMALDSILPSGTTPHGFREQCLNSSSGTHRSTGSSSHHQAEGKRIDNAGRRDRRGERHSGMGTVHRRRALNQRSGKVRR